MRAVLTARTAGVIEMIAPSFEAGSVGMGSGDGDFNVPMTAIALDDLKLLPKE